MKLKVKELLFLGGVLICSVNSFSQEVRKITLEEALELGVVNSKHLLIDSARIVAAEASVEEAKNRQLPDFKISASYLRLTNANLNLKSAQSSGTESESSSSGAAMPKVNQAAYGMANLSMPIFAGGRIRYGIESSKYLLEAARLTTADDENAVMYNISQAYVNLFKAAQVVTVIKEDLKSSKKRDADFLNMENNGLLARNDRLKAQLQTSDLELKLLEAENNYTIANVNMNLMLGLPESLVIEVDSAFVQRSYDVKSIQEYEQLALQNRKDLQATDFQKKAAILDTKSAKAERLPSLALTGGYVAADIPKVLTITNAVNLGVGIQYNLANLWKGNTALKQSKAREAQLDASRNLLVDDLRLNVNSDYQNALLAQRKIEVLTKAATQATENYRITKNKFDNSLVTMTDLLDANVMLLATRINILNARADAALAYKKLLKTTGILYQKNN
ncbi:MAG: TolC family protein [Niabella sp.]